MCSLDNEISTRQYYVNVNSLNYREPNRHQIYQIMSVLNMVPSLMKFFERRNIVTQEITNHNLTKCVLEVIILLFKEES